MTTEEMREEEPELINKTYDQLCYEQDNFEIKESEEPEEEIER